ncbi:transposase [Bacillus thuringiensis]|uniref:Transposase n=1 Tax=Bacillus thuringiensis TaxID=1428 RepID=A0A9X7AUU1_BACTU|nr:transposase [Bacillus thuringiensis]
MGKIRRTFSIDFNMKAIALYLHRGILNTLEVLCLGADRSMKKYKNDWILSLQKNVEGLKK